MVLRRSFSARATVVRRPRDGRNIATDAVVIIYTMRKLFQAVSTPLSCHLPPFAWKFNFLPFTPICAFFWVTPWPYLHFYWQKCYHWMLLQWYIRRESYSRLFLPHSLAISPHLLENSIFGHLPPFVHPHGLPHVIFSLFSDRMCWVEYSLTHFNWKIWIFSRFFISFYIIFAHFSEKPLSGHFTPI